VALPLPTFTPSNQALRELIPESYDLASKLSRSFHDALFVATARSLGLDLITAGKPLFEAASALSLPVIWLGDFSFS